MMKSKLLRNVLIIAGSMLLMGSAVVSLVIISPFSPEASESRPAPIYWWQQDGRFTDKNAAGTFEIKNYVITPSKLYLFYVFQPNGIVTHQLELSQITAFSSEGGPVPTFAPDSTVNPPTPQPTPDSARATPLKVTGLQPIDIIGKTAVGMITLEIPDHNGQLVSLKVSAPNDPKTFWEVTPLHQVLPITGDGWEEGAGGLQYNPRLGPFYSDVDIEMPQMGGKDIMGIVEISSPGLVAPLHLQMDRQGVLSRLTQADCPTVSPSYPTNPPPQNGGPVTATIAVPAPCNKS